LSKNIPSFVIGGVNSGSGKTSVSLGISAFLRQKGMAVQAFKVGPDYLDTELLSAASGGNAYNLDTWMNGKEYCRELFFQKVALCDACIVEGVMGLFDGASADSIEGSTAEVAVLLGLPVILVVNASSMAGSFAAIVKGFCEFNKDVKVAGVIANYCGSDKHVEILRTSLCVNNLPPLLGAIAKKAFPELKSRHLGLVGNSEENISDDKLKKMADVVTEHIDIEKLFSLTSRDFSSSIKTSLDGECSRTFDGITLGGAYDKAFHFYYRDTFERLEERGVKIKTFSLLADKKIPENIDALYIGGGYPEIFAEQLSGNKQMLNSICEFCASTMPVYAECGGLMYLGKGIIDCAGDTYPMCGVLPFKTQMLKKRKALGYVDVETIAASILGDGGLGFRGHEYHYSEIVEFYSGEEIIRPFKISDRKGSVRTGGFAYGNILASYIHINFASNETLLNSFLNRIKEYKNNGK
jgi:cobyrinic acid a,c-diamide synthase